MNVCVACGGPAPAGHELCWFCEHSSQKNADEVFGAGVKIEKNKKQQEVQQEETFECEACRIG